MRALFFSICLLFILDDRALGRRVEIADDDLNAKISKRDLKLKS